MSDSTEETYTITGVVATTGELSGRSYRLGLAYLEKLRDHLLAGDLDIGFDHDSQQTPLSARFISVSLTEEESGEHVLRAQWEVPEAEVERLGTRTGFSIATIDWEVDGWAGVEDPDLVIVPDCYHWDDQDIVDALLAASSDEVRVSGGRLIQLSGAPPVKIIIEVLNNPEAAAALWAAIIAGVTSLVVKLKKKRHESNQESEFEGSECAPQLTFEVSHGSYKAIVNCSTDESAERISAYVVDAVKSLGIPSESAQPLNANDVGDGDRQRMPPA